MTPEEVVVRLRSECIPVNEQPGWCAIHESRWASKVYSHCEAMTDDIDLAEQVAEAERERIAQAIEAQHRRWLEDPSYRSGLFVQATARIARDGGRDA